MSPARCLTAANLMESESTGSSRAPVSVCHHLYRCWPTRPIRSTPKANPATSIWLTRRGIDDHNSDSQGIEELKYMGCRNQREWVREAWLPLGSRSRNVLLHALTVTGDDVVNVPVVAVVAGTRRTRKCHVSAAGTAARLSSVSHGHGGENCLVVLLFDSVYVTDR